MSILINVLTALVCVYDLVDVALPEDVLILSSLKVFGSVDEQDVIRIAVALPLEWMRCLRITSSAAPRKRTP